MNRVVCILLNCFCVSVAVAQTLRSELQDDPYRTAGTLMAYPLQEQQHDTPPPGGKKPFYINHFGCQGSYYQDNPEFYDAPFITLAKADSLEMLTKLGRDVLKRVGQLRSDAYNRSGELSEVGAAQHRNLMKRMVERFPEVFELGTIASGRSTTVNRCILSMEEALVQLAILRPMVISHKASERSSYYLNPQGKNLTPPKMDSATQAVYEDFVARNTTDDMRLMKKLFRDMSYVSSHVDASKLAAQLFELAGSIQNTLLHDSVTLYDLFSPDDLYRHWRQKNAWWYICYGPSQLTGQQQPYMQRRPLRQMIAMSDSIMALDFPVLHLRYSLETVLMPLVCLMELDGFGQSVASLDSLEKIGWADYRIAPMGGNIQMVHYRRSPQDNDVLVKVLLNEREAKLPVPTDCAPYYHWRDVREYYLKKLDAYEEK